VDVAIAIPNHRTGTEPGEPVRHCSSIPRAAPVTTADRPMNESSRQRRSLPSHCSHSHERLDRTASIHGSIGFRDSIKISGKVKDASRIDAAF